MPFPARPLTAAALCLLAACASTVEDAPRGDATAGPTEPSGPGPLRAVQPVTPMPSRAIAGETRLSRILVGSCLSQREDQAIWNRLAQENPDLFLFIGDNVYGDVESGDPAMPELREAYATLAASGPFARFRARTPILTVWDDHDYGLNDAGGTYPFKHAGEALFEEAWALPADDPRRGRDGVYHARVFGPPGERVQVILLDTRFFRSDLKVTDQRDAPGKERYVPDSNPNKTMLGDAQYQWLYRELQKPAELRLIVSSIQVIADGHGFEAWATLPAERQKLYEVIGAAGAEHVVLLSGDRHAGALYRTNGALPYPLYEMTASSLNLPQSTWRAESGTTYVEPGPNRLGGMEYEVNFGVVEIDWTAGTVTLALKGGDGETLQTRTLRLAELQFSD